MQNLQLQPPGCLTHLPAQWLGVATSPAPHFVRESCPAASPRNSFKCRSKALQAAADSPACPRQRRRLCPTEHGRQHDHWHIHAAAGDAANAWNSSDSDARMGHNDELEDSEEAGPSRRDVTDDAAEPAAHGPFAFARRMYSRLSSAQWQHALQVPWSGRRTLETLLLWLAAYWTFSHGLLPAGVEWLGLDTEGNIAAALTSRRQALVHVVLDLGNLALTHFILRQSLREFKPRKNLPWFRPRWAGSLRQWAWLPLACLLLPLVEKAIVWSQGLFPTVSEQWGVTLIEQSVTSGDPVAAMLYFTMVVFCAPFWEELMFRGFLLPSLAKLIPLPAAVFLSSTFFALIHFSVQRFLPLLLLGIVFGLVFVGSRNLASPIALHALYNTYIFGRVVSRALGV